MPPVLGGEGRKRHLSAMDLLRLGLSQSVHSGLSARRLLDASGRGGPHPYTHHPRPPESTLDARGGPLHIPQFQRLLPDNAEHQRAAAAAGATSPSGGALGGTSSGSPSLTVTPPPSGASMHRLPLHSPPGRSGGSGHALEHYAFLMGVGERSVRGLRNMSLNKAMLLPGQSPEGGATGAGNGSAARVLPLLGKVGGGGGAVPHAAGGTSSHPLPNSSEDKPPNDNSQT